MADSHDIDMHNVFRVECSKMAETLAAKQNAYGDSYKSVGVLVRALYPKGIPVEAMDDALTMVRMLDKMKRIANNPGKADPGGEDPFHDIAGYAILAQMRRAGR